MKIGTGNWKLEFWDYTCETKNISIQSDRSKFVWMSGEV